MPRIVMAVKRPIPIKFTLFKQPGDHPAVIATTESPTGFAMQTLENVGTGQHVSLGDWICDGTSGDPYPIKPDIFATTYEIMEIIGD